MIAVLPGGFSLILRFRHCSMAQLLCVAGDPARKQQL